jgi:LAO/AO transport system kinase
LAKAKAEELISRVKAGDAGAASRALSLVVNEAPESAKLSKAFFKYSGTVQKIGLCGPPGTGKSTLMGKLVAYYRAQGVKIGVLAVDPSSHISGGAFLGDRLRIQDHALDPGVFIRSLASRGTVGGLSHTIFGAIHVLEAYGCGKILIETVGTGQDEVEIARVADTVLYLTAPQMGDEIQAMKAGSMEIADCFVVNKADLQGKDKAIHDIKSALALGGALDKKAWPPPVIATSATEGTGIEELGAAIAEHWAHLQKGEGKTRLKEQHRQELSLYLQRRIYQAALGKISNKLLDDLAAHKTDPVAAGKKLVK